MSDMTDDIDHALRVLHILAAMEAMFQIMEYDRRREGIVLHEPEAAARMCFFDGMAELSLDQAEEVVASMRRHAEAGHITV
jgi:hypothetical protein